MLNPNCLFSISRDISQVTEVGNEDIILLSRPSTGVSKINASQEMEGN